MTSRRRPSFALAPARIAPLVRLRRGRLGGERDREDPARRPAAPDDGGAHRGRPQRVRGLPGGRDRPGARRCPPGRRALEGPGRLDDVKLYRVDLIDCRRRPRSTARTGRWPDALVPDVDDVVGEKRNAFPFDVAAGESRAIWVEVRVPPDAKPGAYFGNVTVTSAEGEAQIPVTLTVWDFELPVDVVARRPTSASSYGAHRERPRRVAGDGDADAPRAATARSASTTASRSPASPTTATTATSPTSIASTAARRRHRADAASGREAHDREVRRQPAPRSTSTARWAEHVRAEGLVRPRSSTTPATSRPSPAAGTSIHARTKRRPRGRPGVQDARHDADLGRRGARRRRTASTSSSPW